MKTDTTSGATARHTPALWLELASNLEILFEDWRRQDGELESARRGLEPEDRDAGQEQVENQRVNENRARFFKRAILACGPINEMRAALQALLAHGETVNRAFYVDGTSKAMRAAMMGQKELLQAARAAIAATNTEET